MPPSPRAGGTRSTRRVGNDSVPPWPHASWSTSPVRWVGSTRRPTWAGRAPSPRPSAQGRSPVSVSCWLWWSCEPTSRSPERNPARRRPGRRGHRFCRPGRGGPSDSHGREHRRRPRLGRGRDRGHDRSVVSCSDLARRRLCQLSRCRGPGGRDPPVGRHRRPLRPGPRSRRLHRRGGDDRTRWPGRLRSPPPDPRWPHCVVPRGAGSGGRLDAGGETSCSTRVRTFPSATTITMPTTCTSTWGRASASGASPDAAVVLSA